MTRAPALLVVACSFVSQTYGQTGGAASPIVIEGVYNAPIRLQVPLTNRCTSAARVDIFVHLLPFIEQAPLYAMLAPGETRQLELTGRFPAAPWSESGGTLTLAYEGQTGAASCAPRIFTQPIVIRAASTSGNEAPGAISPCETRWVLGMNPPSGFNDAECAKKIDKVVGRIFRTTNVRIPQPPGEIPSLVSAPLGPAGTGGANAAYIYNLTALASKGDLPAQLALTAEFSAAEGYRRLQLAEWGFAGWNLPIPQQPLESLSPEIQGLLTSVVVAENGASALQSAAIAQVSSIPTMTNENRALSRDSVANYINRLQAFLNKTRTDLEPRLITAGIDPGPDLMAIGGQLTRRIEPLVIPPPRSDGLIGATSNLAYDVYRASAQEDLVANARLALDAHEIVTRDRTKNPGAVFTFAELFASSFKLRNMVTGSGSAPARTDELVPFQLDPAGNSPGTVILNLPGGWSTVPVVTTADMFGLNPQYIQNSPSQPRGQVEGGTTDGAAFVVPGNGQAPRDASPRHVFARLARQAPAVGAPLTVYVTSLGISAGEAFTLTALNNGPTPVTLNADDLVLEPVDGITSQQIARDVANHRGPGKLTTTLTAYCLEFAKAPPAAGSVFRLANRSLTDKFSGYRHIMAATRRMHHYGLLPPDGGDPRAYFHFIRQWAVWTKEQAFDETRFGDAFVEHTRKNAEAASRQWTPAFEQAARRLVPGRWKAVQFAVQEADRFERAERTQRADGGHAQ